MADVKAPTEVAKVSIITQCQQNVLDLVSVQSNDYSEVQQIQNQKLLRLRKAKSRDAARSRRGKENYEFYELAKLLPISNETSSQLDKASIIRLTMSCLKMRDFIYLGDWPWSVPSNAPPPNRTVKDASASSRIDMNFSPQTVAKVFDNNLGSHSLQCLDGFIFVINEHGKFLYVSETVSIYLGLAQVEMIGSNIIHFTHPDDHGEILKQLGHEDLETVKQRLIKHDASNEKNKDTTVKKKEIGQYASFFLRMKSTLVRRGLNVRSSGYKVLHITARIRFTKTEDSKENPNKKIMGLAGIATALPPPSVNDIQLEPNMFVTRMSSALTITYCESRIKDLLDYETNDLIGQNLYHCVHASDVAKLKHAHTNLLNKGQVMTAYYRWLKKNGGYVWVQSCVTVAANQKLYPGPSYIWINSVICCGSHDIGICNITQMDKCEANKRMEESSRKYKIEFTVPPVTKKQILLKAVKNENKNDECGKLVDDNNNNTDKIEHLNKDDTHKVISNTKKKEVVVQPEIKPMVAKKRNKPVCKSVLKRSSSNEDDKKKPKKQRKELKSSTENISTSLKTMTAETQLKKKISAKGESDTDFLDTDSQVWENPPNKEISNHNELPPGIKEMHGLLTIRQQPTVVDHHYPFGINPTVLQTNPLLAKMFSLSPYTTPNRFVFRNPLQLMALSDQERFPSIYTTPTSVMAVLEELKKDPMHRVNPPNKVVLPPNSKQYDSSCYPGLFLPMVAPKASASVLDSNSSLTSITSTSSKISQPSIMTSPEIFGASDPMLMSRLPAAAHIILPSSPHALITSQALPQNAPPPLLLGSYYQTQNINQNLSSVPLK